MERIRNSAPDELVESKVALEEEWGDWLVSQRQAWFMAWDMMGWDDVGDQTWPVGNFPDKWRLELEDYIYIFYIYIYTLYYIYIYYYILLLLFIIIINYYYYYIVIHIYG